MDRELRILLDSLLHAPMPPRTSLETIATLLQYIMQDTLPFGGRIMVLGGDFRQILPVLERGSRAPIVESGLKHSSLLHHFHTFHLHHNMRLTDGDPVFREWLLKLGNGELPPDMDVPDSMRSNGNLAELIFADGYLKQRDVDLAELTILRSRRILRDQ